MLISTALLLDSIIRNSVCTPAKLPCRRVEVGYENNNKYLNISRVHEQNIQIVFGVHEGYTEDYCPKKISN
jgi:hypothetical protein